MKIKKHSYLLLFIIAISSTTTGCLPYIYHQRSEALIEGVDIDQTLEIAERELEEGGLGSVLTVWAIRDQVVTPEQASRISQLYFQYIPGPILYNLIKILSGCIRFQHQQKILFLKGL